MRSLQVLHDSRKSYGGIIVFTVALAGYFTRTLCIKFYLPVNPIRAGGAESACTFFKGPFLNEYRGLEVPNFVTFPNSL